MSNEVEQSDRRSASDRETGLKALRDAGVGHLSDIDAGSAVRFAYREFGPGSNR